MDEQRFCLRWDSFKDNVSHLLEQLREDGELLDVTLCCDGHQVRAHRLVLSMCSPYFRQVLKVSEGQPKVRPGLSKSQCFIIMNLILKKACS